MENFEKFLNSVLRFLAFRPRSKKEIVDFLKRKKIEPSIGKKILKRLKEQRLINDREFVKWWIEQRLGSHKPKGIRLIKLELQQKGIDRKTTDEILGYYDTKTLSENATRRLVEKQYNKYAKLPKLEIRQKLAQFLLRRGFEWETIKQAIDEIFKK